MTTYRVLLNNGESFRFSADLSDASAPIWLLDEDGDRQTPFQTADARHREREAAALLVDYFDMAVQPDGTIPDDFGPEEAAAMIVNVEMVDE